MLRVGLTGNIGSGKSLVCKIFESTGIPVFKADEAGHAALEDQKIKDNLLYAMGVSLSSPMAPSTAANWVELFLASLKNLNISRVWFILLLKSVLTPGAIGKRMLKL